MDFVGKYIQKERRSKKISLDFVSTKLNISKDILLKIENDELDPYIDKVYFLGHVRAYVKFLNLDINKVVEQFKIQNSFYKSPISNQIPKPLNLSNNLFSGINKVISFATILIVSSSFYLLFIKDNNSIREYAIIPDIPVNLEPLVEKTNIEINNTKNLKANDPIDIFEENLSSSSVVASTNSKTEQIKYETITLKFLNPTWVQMRDKDDNIILSKLMAENDEYTYDLDLSYSLTAGNAGNILVIINNDIKGKIGDYGEVVDSFIIESNFNN